MSALEERLTRQPTIKDLIDEVIASRYACREFDNRPVSRRDIEDLLRVARFAPSGANIQPWKVYVLGGEFKDKVTTAILHAYWNASAEHVSEYSYYASELPSPYRDRRQQFGARFYGSLGIEQNDTDSRSNQTAKNYRFFGAPIGVIVTIDRRLALGSWLDLGMFVQNVMIAASGRGLRSCPQETFARFHKVLRPLLAIPPQEMVVCGISIGFAKEPSVRLMPRAEVREFATFYGFEE